MQTMKNTLKAFSNPSNASASIVDGKLILSLPDAITPVVWQMDFSSVKASALEVRQGKDGTFTLTLKTPKGEALDIAPFAKREQAISGLMAAARALENAQGRIRPGAAGEAPASAVYTAPAGKSAGGKWLGTLVALVVLLILIGIWGSLAPRPPASAAQNSTIAAPAGNAGEENGVPLSADDFLKGK
jgi:hypothetical protein